MSNHRTILIVDYLPSDRAIVQNLLLQDSNHSYLFLEAASGEEALKMLQTETPDCIVLDASFPMNQLLSVFNALKEADQRLKFPVIMMSDMDSSHLAFSALQQGAQDFLFKSRTTSEALIRSLNNAIEKHNLWTRIETQNRELLLKNGELEAANEALRKSEARLALGVYVAGLGLASVDYITGNCHLSVEAARQFGLGETAMVVPREAVHAVIHPEDYAEVMMRITAAHDPQGTGWFEMEHRVVLTGGAVRWLRVRKQVFFEGEGEAKRPVSAKLAVIDVTAAKEMTQTIQASKSRYEYLLNASPVAIFSCVPSDDFRATYVSENVESILGYVPQQLREENFWIDRIHQDDKERMLAELMPLFERGRHSHEYRFQMGDGTYRWVHDALTLVRDETGKPVEIIGALQDISDRKAAEARLQLALEAGRAGTFLHDLTTNRVTWSAHLERIAGYEPGGFGGTFDDFLVMIHPDDKEAMATIIQDAIARCAEYTFEFRLKCSDDSVIWLAGRGLVYSQNGGEADTITGVAFDITERKLAEEKLRQSKARLRAIFDGTHEYIGLLEPDGTMIASNRASLAFANTKLEDVIGVPFWETVWFQFTPGASERVREAVTRAASGEYVCIDTPLINPAGEELYFEISFEPVRNENGEVMLIVPEGRDVTERKRREQDLAFLAEVQTELASLETSEAMMRFASRRIAEHLRLARCLFMEIDADKHEAKVLTSWFQPPLQSIASIYSLVKYHSDEEIENLVSGQPIVIHDVRDAARTEEAAARFEALGIGSLVNVPYSSKGVWRFVLCAMSSHPRQWQTREVELLSELAALIYVRIERARAEEMLRVSEERLRFALQSASAGAWNWDIGTGKIEWSPENYRIFDVDIRQGAVLYSDWEKCLHPEDLASANQAVQDVIDGKMPDFRTEFRVIRRTGEVRWVLGSGSVERDADGNAVRMSGINLDITERKQQQQEIAALNTRLHRAVFEGSHRIKNQLQLLAGMVEMQASESGTMVSVEELQRIQNHILAMAAIHDVLTLTTKENAENDVVPVKSLLDRLMSLLQHSGGTHSLRFECDDALLSAKQASSLVLVINELVSNAMKHGKDTVEATFRVRDGNGILEICDDGDGFPEDFNPRQAANTGLEIVGSIARIDLSGSVVYDNTYAGGRVTVTFPLLLS